MVCSFTIPAYMIMSVFWIKLLNLVSIFKYSDIANKSEFVPFLICYIHTCIMVHYHVFDWTLIVLLKLFITWLKTRWPSTCTLHNCCVCLMLDKLSDFQKQSWHLCSWVHVILLLFKCFPTENQFFWLTISIDRAIIQEFAVGAMWKTDQREKQIIWGLRVSPYFAR